MHEIIRFADIFSHLTPVENLILGNLESVFDPWYAVTDTGDVDETGTSTMFETWQALLPDQFPIMSLHDPRHGGPRHGDVMAIGGVHCYGGSNSNFDHTARIKPPFWAGERCTIRAGAYVNTASVIGDRTTIKRRVDVSASFIRKRAQIDANAIVNHSLLGEDVYIGVGVCLLHKPLRAKYVETVDYRDDLEECVSTRRRKLGTVAADGVIIDTGAIVHPGTVFLSGCAVPAGAVVPSGIYTKELIEKRFGRARP